VLSNQPITSLDIPALLNAFANAQEAAAVIRRLRTELNRWASAPVTDVRDSPNGAAVREYTVRRSLYGNHCKRCVTFDANKSYASLVEGAS
jgi:hypothetical protein